MLASDYDGTLRQGNEVNQKTIDTINEFRKRGNLFGIVTGRDYVNGFEYFKRTNEFPFDFVITCSGAAAYDKEGNPYFIKRINGKQSFGESTLVQEFVTQCLKLTPYPCGI